MSLKALHTQNWHNFCYFVHFPSVISPSNLSLTIMEQGLYEKWTLNSSKDTLNIILLLTGVKWKACKHKLQIPLLTLILTLDILGHGIFEDFLPLSIFGRHIKHPKLEKKDIFLSNNMNVLYTLVQCQISWNPSKISKIRVVFLCPLLQGSSLSSFT